MPDPKIVSIASDTHSEFEAYVAVDDKGRVWRGQTVSDQRKNIRIEWEPIESRFRETK
jgi:hypothetical protein